MLNFFLFSFFLFVCVYFFISLFGWNQAQKFILIFIIAQFQYQRNLTLLSICTSRSKTMNKIPNCICNWLCVLCICAEELPNGKTESNKSKKRQDRVAADISGEIIHTHTHIRMHSGTSNSPVEKCIKILFN